MTSLSFTKLTRILVFTALFLAQTIPFSAANAQIFGDFGQPAWSRMYKYFETRLVGQNLAKDDSVFILPTATAAAWDDPNQNLRLMEMYHWGDYMPSTSWLYQPNSGKRISDGYQYFLDAAFIAALDKNGTAKPELKNAIKRSSEELDFTRADYNDTISAANQAYEDYANRTSWYNRKTKAIFFAEQQWQTQIDAKKKRLDDAADTFEVLAQALVDPDVHLLKDAKLRFSNPKQKILLPPVREVVNDRERWQPYFTSYIDKDIFKFLKESKPENQDIIESQAKSAYFEQTWNASVSVSFLGLFRAGGASADHVKREKHAKENTTRIAIAFRNIDTFNIVRGDWFDQNLIDGFAPKLSAKDFQAIFGPNGQLEYIPKTLLVGRGMTFSIYADSQSIDYLYEHFHAGADAGIFIGWWRIGGGGGYSSTKEETEVKRFADHIDFVDLTGRGQVLGMVAKHVAGVTPHTPYVAPLEALGIAASARTKASDHVKELWSVPKFQGLETPDKELLINSLIRR